VLPAKRKAGEVSLLRGRGLFYAEDPLYLHIFILRSVSRKKQVSNSQINGNVTCGFIKELTQEVASIS